MNNKKVVRILDIILISCIILHFATAFLTKYAIGTNLNPKEDRIIETNKVQRVISFESNDEFFEEMPKREQEKQNTNYKVFVLSALVWILIIFGYITNRRGVVKNNYRECLYLYNLLFISVIASVVVVMDFIQDFGFYIGVLIGQ